METISLESLLYEQLPLETVVRHEVGHAVMASSCGGYVKRIITGHTASGEPFGLASCAAPGLDEYLLVLSGGALALYLHECPYDPTFEDFCAWASTLDGYVKAASGVSDWAEILRLTHQPEGFGMEDFLERAVRPYFNSAVGRLAKAADQLDELTELVIARPPGLGRLSLQRFFAGRPPNRWAERFDRPRVLWAASTAMRGGDSAD